MGLYGVLLAAVRSLPATRKKLDDEGFSIG
jgi:hypothetical protein